MSTFHTFIILQLSQVADGMAFLHSTNPPILHRDLRCGNLFVTDNDVIKVRLLPYVVNLITILLLLLILSAGP